MFPDQPTAGAPEPVQGTGMEPEDRQDLDRARRGHDDAFRALVERHSRLPLRRRPPGDRQRSRRGGRGAGGVAEGAQAAGPIRGPVGRPHLAAPDHRQLRHRLHPRPAAPRAGLRPDRPARRRRRPAPEPGGPAGAGAARRERPDPGPGRRGDGRSSPRRSAPPSCCATSRGCRSTRSGAPLG